MTDKIKNKPGPKIGSVGKKESYPFSLSHSAREKLLKISKITGVSMSGWIEKKIMDFKIHP